MRLAIKSIMVIAMALTSETTAFACDGILSLTRNVSLDVNQALVAQHTYMNECSGKSLKSGWSAQAGGEGVYQMMPVKLKLAGGSQKEKAEHLCKNFDEWKAANTDTLNFAMSTPAPAIEAWLTCKRLEGEKVFFTVEPVRERVGLSVRRGPEVVKFFGMTYDKDKITCSGPFGKNTANVEINQETRFDLLQGTEYPITCTRKLLKDDAGTEFYPADTIGIAAQGKPPLLVPLNREELDGGVFLTELEKQTKALREEVNKISARKLECKNFQNNASSGAHLLDVTANVDPGYVVTGGGCHLDNVQPGRWGFFSSGTITADGKGWYCRSEPQINVPFSRRLIATAIGCRYTQ